VPAPAVQSAIEAVLAKVEAIGPTIDSGQQFRRVDEKAPLTTRGGKRLFEFDFGAMRDLSNEGAGVQNAGLADRVASVVIAIGYPLARAEKTLETTLAVDSELVLRALGRSANWAGTVVRRVVARTAIDRTDAEATEVSPGIVYLLVSADIFYRDTE
jgi:hypothetical protein